MMLPYAQSISKLQHEYQTTAYNYLHSGIQNLRIASIPAMAQYHITDTLLNFQLECPSVQIHTMEDDRFVVREALINNKCDLAFFRDSELYVEHDPDKEIRLAKLQFCQDQLVTVLPRNHPLAGADHLELSELANENFVLIKQGSMPYKLCIRACESAGFSPV